MWNGCFLIFFWDMRSLDGSIGWTLIGIYSGPDRDPRTIVAVYFSY